MLRRSLTGLPERGGDLLARHAMAGDDERADTGFVVGLVEPGGERTFVTAPGAESRLEPHDLRSLPLRPGDAVYVSGYDLVYPVSGRSLQEWLPGLPLAGGGRR